MLNILLIIIYLAFISLGLPDAVLGSAWPTMHKELNVHISLAGVCTMVITAGTVISSFFSGKLISRFGTGKVTAFSVFLTAFALLGIYISSSFIWILLLSIPLGLGAGAVDSALNNFVAIYYKAKHMNWLHCFWGIGATSGPFIIALYLLKESGWRMGYATIGIIQSILVVFLFLSLPLWKKFELDNDETLEEKSNTKILNLVKIPGVKSTLITFFSYCAMELTAGLWGSSYLVVTKGVSTEEAAKYISLYYLGITIGRFLSGFLTLKLGNKQMIKIGQITCILGISILIMPLSINFQLMGLILIGLGCAPIYPAMLHETPNKFGKEISQKIMGIQMSVAYIGSALVPPLFGILAGLMGFEILPFFLLALVIMMYFMSEKTSRLSLE